MDYLGKGFVVQTFVHQRPVHGVIAFDETAEVVVWCS